MDTYSDPVKQCSLCITKHLVENHLLQKSFEIFKA
jgi:hypothetical protein